MMIANYDNEGSGGPSYSHLRVEVGEYDIKSSEQALRLITTSRCGGSTILRQSSARQLIAALVAAFPERRKTERRKA